ncbi:MAG: ROK family protein [Saprospiraceae bacterium]|nr:ROK family protein [Saprospiraceae bacterium]
MGKNEQNQMLGIDVGATGIKGAIINLHTGQLVTDRIRFDTPKPATPEAVARVIKEIAKEAGWPAGAPIGCGFPSVVVRGKTLSAANIDQAWLNLKAQKFLSTHTGHPVILVNDADAAGIAALRFGHVKNQTGTVVLLTIGTGIGSALFVDGKLVPNTEFGHMPYKRSIVEDYVSNRARKDRKLSMPEWAKQLNVYLKHIDRMLTPDLIVLGGGISKRFATYEKYLNPGTPVVPAKLLNNAGLIGAALHAQSVLT